jgi:maltooligosyltrehalose trehalohydrolase
MLLDAQRLAAAETLLLLLPGPILLFMGDEFHAPSRFPFFCDFSGELAAAIRSGRRRDFAALLGDAMPPDPNDPAERQSAVLDWAALERPPHRTAFERYSRLLRVRRTRLEPLLPAGRASGALDPHGTMTVRWPLARGARLKLVANLTERAAAPLERGTGELLGATHEREAARGALPAWSVAWYLER